MEHVLSLSYGKDSLAALYVILEVLHWPLDRIIHAEVWATDTIHADLPPMVAFKETADRIIKERWGFDVEHVQSKLTYEQAFYRIRGKDAKHRPGMIYGWPFTVKGAWCNSDVKRQALRIAQKAGDVQYWGIAADEPERIAKHKGKPNVKLPLVEAGWTEAMCRKWCEENGLLSPIYTDAARGGCWFCHNQGVDQLRLLRKNYPEYWALMLKWDKDSPVTFKADGHTVHDYDLRFLMEDAGVLWADRKFRWDMTNQMFIELPE